VDVTEEKDLGSKYEIQGFPTIKYFPAGSAEATDAYEGARDLEPMVEYINEKTGLQRTPDGGLMPMAGRVATIDTILKGYAKIDKTAIDGIKTIVAQLTGTVRVRL
jgi:protein disulfide-isomerase A6